MVSTTPTAGLPHRCLPRGIGLDHCSLAGSGGGGVSESAPGALRVGLHPGAQRRRLQPHLGDGTSAVSSDTAVAGVISKIRGAGRDVSVSVGGYGGTKLGQACADVASTAAAYQQVVTKYGLEAIDFDLEEPEYEDSAAIAKELCCSRTTRASSSR